MPPKIELRGRVLAGLRIDNPKLWLRVVRAKLQSHGNFPDAAEDLEIDKRTLEYWARKTPELLEGIEMRARGRPKT